jgi:hypothetical protein
MITVACKSFTTKVMFISALARPQYNYTTRQWFEGQIGIYPAGELHMYLQISFMHRQGDIKWSTDACSIGVA